MNQLTRPRIVFDECAINKIHKTRAGERAMLNCEWYRSRKKFIPVINSYSRESERNVFILINLQNITSLIFMPRQHKKELGLWGCCVTQDDIETWSRYGRRMTLLMYESNRRWNCEENVIQLLHGLLEGCLHLYVALTCFDGLRCWGRFQRP